jgi:HAD superfamily hydrolase (TIGR01484 family)
MGKYDGILICSDLDGTLCEFGGKISNKNLEAIEYFIENGGRFSLSTGRSPHYAKKLEKSGLYCNAPIIALNGSMIYDIQKEKILYQNPMDYDKISDITEFLKEYGSYLNEAVYHSIDTVESFEDIIDKVLYKILFVCKDADSAKIFRRALEEKYNKGFFVVNSWDAGVEILDEKSTKGECILKMREFLEVDKIICVGDYENDISMLLNADVSYAVSNAIPEVKAVATKVTVSNNESALAALISEL